MARKSAYLDFEGVPFVFDVVLSETAEHTATATEHPVEQGANIADHVIDNLDAVSLEIKVSNSPLEDLYGFGLAVAGLDLKVPTIDRPIAPTPGALMSAGIDAIKSALAGPVAWKALVLQLSDTQNFCSFVLGTLIDWKKRAVVGKVILGDRTYESMVITSITSKRDGSTGDALDISLTLKEIRLVEAKLVTAPKPTETRGMVSKPKGRQPASFVRDPAPKKSVLKKILGG